MHICLFLLKLEIANLNSKRKNVKKKPKQYQYHFSLLRGPLLQGSTMMNIDRAYKSNLSNQNIFEEVAE